MATIRPLLLGKIQDIGSPLIAFLVETTKGEKIMVDLGPGRPDDVLAWKKRVITKEPDQGLSEQLQIAGVDPAEIKTVILTHLHWDHAGEFGHFPNAPIFVHREEIRFAIDPLPEFYYAYMADVAGYKSKWLPHISRMKVIEGDYYELNDEVALLLLPGHSPGMMGVLVKTSTGRLCIASDLVAKKVDWEEKNPPRVRHSLEDCYKSYQKLEKMADEIVYGHDLCVFDRKIYE